MHLIHLYHVAIPTDVSLLSLTSRRQSRAAGLQRMTMIHDVNPSQLSGASQAQ